MAVPEHPKIYHICHVDRLPSILVDGNLQCDAQIGTRDASGTVIGMSDIKRRRLHDLTLASHPSLYVGQCVPFYFCPRSVMLYLIHKANHPQLSYRGGQGPIIHLVADLHSTVTWANEHELRWAFSLSNAGSYYFEDRSDLAQLDQIDWRAVESDDWKDAKEARQAEFLIEQRFPWHLVERIGVQSQATYQRVVDVLSVQTDRPAIEIRRNWYY